MTYDPELTMKYRTALEAFRAGDARPFQVYLAGVLNAASVLLDPGQVMILGCDPTAGDQYDVVNAQVWDRLCDAERNGVIDGPKVHEILMSEYGSNFGGWVESVSSEDGTVASGAEHEGTPADAPAGTAKMAEMLWHRLCQAETAA